MPNQLTRLVRAPIGNQGPFPGLRANYSAQMFPAPVKGLDVRNTLFGQDPATAVILKNALCRRYGVELRLGYQRWVSNIPGNVVSVMSYLPPQGPGAVLQPKLFAASSNGNIYDVTLAQDSAFVPPVAVAIAGQVSPGRFSWTNFSTGNKNYLCIVSDGGGYWTYEAGLGWQNQTGNITGTGATHAIHFDFVMAWKNRLWFIENNTADAWFLGTNAIVGNATNFDFGPLFVFGGDLAAMASWTLDAGNGIDDKLVLVSRGGDVLVYEGTDPTSVATFRIIGRWHVGLPPIGRRFMSKYGGDLTLITGNGIERMSFLTQARGLLVPGGELGFSGDEGFARYMETIAKEVRATQNDTFWTLVHIPQQQCILVTTPRNTQTYSLQYAFGTLSHGWSEFGAVPMYCAEMHQGDLYFGTKTGTVCKMFTGETDDSFPVETSHPNGQVGRTVIADIQTAFVAPGENVFNTKRMLMANPQFLAPNPPSVKAQVNTDWSFQQVPGSPVYVARDYAQWDISKWDQALWSGSDNHFQAWTGAEGLGTHASLRLSFTGNQGTTFTSWKLVSEIGKGVL